MKSKFNPWPVGIMMFFTMLFMGLAIVIVIASMHRETLVSENYYEQELKFQGQIEAAGRAEKSGAKLGCDAAAKKVFVSLPAEQLDHNFSGKIYFYRASAPELDRELPLEPKSDGGQAVDVSGFAAGAWTVSVRWNAGGQDYFLEQKIKI
jgi:nitrogen fixation protein FixH